MSADINLVVKICRRDPLATTRLLADAEVNGKLKECVTAEGATSSVYTCMAQDHYPSIGINQGQGRLQ
jgi:hypothetical protein